MKIKFVLLIILFSQIGYSQISDTIMLWEDAVPQNNELNPSVKKGSYEGIFKVDAPLLLAFVPEKKVDKKVAVIVCPGGGFTHLSIAKEGYEIAEWFNTLGITAFVLQYSVPGKKEQAISDIQRSIKLIRYHADKWDINPDKLGVIGFSAGGNLSARVSCVPEKIAYKPTDKADKVSCLPNFTLLIYPGGLGREADGNLLPHLSFGDSTPPMFIFGTADDKITNYGSLYLAQELYRSKIPVELHILSEGGHGYGMRTNRFPGQVWPELAEKWLYKYVCN